MRMAGEPLDEQQHLAEFEEVVRHRRSISGAFCEWAQRLAEIVDGLLMLGQDVTMAPTLTSAKRMQLLRECQVQFGKKMSLCHVQAIAQLRLRGCGSLDRALMDFAAAEPSHDGGRMDELQQRGHLLRDAQQGAVDRVRFLLDELSALFKSSLGVVESEQAVLGRQVGAAFEVFLSACNPQQHEALGLSEHLRVLLLERRHVRDLSVQLCANVARGISSAQLAVSGEWSECWSLSVAHAMEAQYARAVRQWGRAGRQLHMGLTTAAALLRALSKWQDTLDGLLGVLTEGADRTTDDDARTNVRGVCDGV
jgi:hypothetical protein